VPSIAIYTIIMVGCRHYPAIY